jgi:hypothetical protein
VAGQRLLAELRLLAHLGDQPAMEKLVSAAAPHTVQSVVVLLAQRERAAVLAALAAEMASRPEAERRIA